MSLQTMLLCELIAATLERLASQEDIQEKDRALADLAQALRRAVRRQDKLLGLQGEADSYRRN